LQLLRQALEALPVGVVVEDGSRRTIASNRLARSPLGEVAGDALAGAALNRAMVQARMGRAGSEALDLHGPRARRLEVTASPLEDGGVVAVLVDATERRRLDAVRRDFVANVNHELRTPIGALGVLADALSGEQDPATLERLAGRISTEVERARALIEDLLDFSRVEADHQRTPERVAIADVVEIATARVSARAEQKGVHLDLPEAEGLPTLDGDREQLIMAVANLVDNAVKYSEAGTTVRVTASPEDGAVVISVSDQGIGIPARDLDRIFERFYRVDAARDRRTGGTGLGLAIVRHVAANHGGTVSVRSQEGVGSTFTLQLPVSAGSA
jgi:two-component system sensor histidine kinase SenX3